MSYILDALRKSQQERRRGKAPDLSTVMAFDVEVKKTRRKRLSVFVGLLAAGAAVAGWYFGMEQQPPPPPLKQAVLPAAPTAAPPQPPADPLPSGVQAASATPSAAEPQAALRQPAPPKEEVRPQAKPSRSASESRPAKPLEQRRVEKAAPAATAVKKETQPAGGPGVAGEETAADKTAPDPKRLYAVNDLPEEIRRGLPSLAISTHIFGPDASERLVGIDGQIAREGQDIVPGLRLEKITGDGAIVVYQGYRIKAPLR